MSKFVIQIGAADGKTDSHRDIDEVWELVHKHGWRALILEPNPRHFQELCSNYKGNNKVTLQELAIGNCNGKVSFYDCKLFGASTLIESVLARNNYHNGQTKNYQVITVKCHTVQHILEIHGVPDYLVIDAEGFDGTILEMLNLAQFPIPKIRFEFAHLEIGQTQQAQLGRVCLKLIKAGYTLRHDMADIIAEKI